MALRFSRQEAIQIHRNLQNQAANINQVGFTSLPSYLDKFCKPFSLSSKPFGPIKLSQLQLDYWHQGRALKGHLIAPAFNVKNLVATVLEDEDGNAARMFVANVDSSPQSINTLLPENAEVLIKEPCLVTKHMMMDGTFLWVANPACLQVVSYFGKQEFELPKAMQLAKEEFAKGNFAATVEIYSTLLESGNTETVTCLTGRGECWLRLKRFENALDDAEKALNLEPSHIRSLQIKIQALWGMQQYRSAHDFSEQTMVGIPQLKTFCDKALLYKEQSENGTHDLSEFYIGGLKSESTPDVAEFVGPIDIRISEGRGRGLFLTSDVRKGDLLIVSNAVVRIPLSEEVREKISHGDSSQLLAKVVEVCLSSNRILSQIYSMSEASRGLGIEIWSKKIEKGAPNVSLFKPNYRNSSREEREFDVVKIHNILDTSTEFSLRDDYSDGFVGFWTLPAFINHSCLTNVCVRKFGRSMFVFAARNMKSGTELMRSYGHSLHPSGRKARSTFTCCCERCILEGKLQIKLKGINDVYNGKVLEGQYQKSGEVVCELENLIKKESLSRRETHWIRAMYPAAYLSCFAGIAKKDGLKLPCEDEMMEALHETAPGDMVTLTMMSSFAQSASGRGWSLLMDECAAAYGRTSPKVANAILEHLQAGRIGGTT